MISIVQTSPDFCEAYLPYGTNVTFSYDDLGLQDGDTYKLSVDEFGPGRTVGANMVVNSMNGTQKSTSDIMGIKFSHDGVSLQVSSGGCTDKNDFSVVVRETFPTQTEINRINRDGCEAYLPYGTDVLFTGAELGLSESANRLRLILSQVSGRVIR